MIPPSMPKIAVGACVGDGCTARDPWPLHHVRHRSIFCRLCTSCVLKYNPSSFCSLCFSFLDFPLPPTAAVVHCSTCPLVSHLSCLPNPNLASQFVCPCCQNGEEKLLFFPKIDGGKRRVIDLESSRVLLTATRLAVESMGRAAVAARAEVERKVKEAVVARKRAREMLERNVASVVGVGLKKTGLGEEMRRKKKKRGKSREIEKWMRFQEMIPMMKEDEKGKLLSCQGGKDEEKGMQVAESRPEDALVSKTSPKPTSKGSPKHN